jgi:gliding motility-associated-like protein
MYIFKYTLLSLCLLVVCVHLQPTQVNQAISVSNTHVNPRLPKPSVKNKLPNNRNDFIQDLKTSLNPKNDQFVQDTNALKKTSWYENALAHIAESEYYVNYNASTKTYQASNRYNQFVTYYNATSYTLQSQQANEKTCNLSLTLQGIFCNNQLIFSPQADAPTTLSQTRIQYNHNDNFITEYINNKEGLRQNFIINKRPNNSNQLSVKLSVDSTWRIIKESDSAIYFVGNTILNKQQTISYNDLHVWDANNKKLPATFTIDDDGFAINVSTEHATFPITIDPLSNIIHKKGISNNNDKGEESINNTTNPSDVITLYLGSTVATAGDVNGDGYSDVIVGAPRFDNGANTDEGAAYIFHGSATGLQIAPSVTLKQANQAEALFGYSVATAGDVNGDGYSDVIVGAFSYDGASTDEGAAYLYLGSATGITNIPVTLNYPSQANASFGFKVATAGDVNADGFSDIMVSAVAYDNGNNINEGVVYVYHGNNAGVSTTPNYVLDDANQTSAAMGCSIASAGDINGDGFSDVIIGSRLHDVGANVNEGLAYIYMGGTNGLEATPSSTLHDANQPAANFGNSVSSAGDVNGDGYSDVLVGSDFYDVGANTNAGAVFIYHGAANGIITTPNITLTAQNQFNKRFGNSVTCGGDVNGDGYSDILIGASGFEANNALAQPYMYLGAKHGIPYQPGIILNFDTDIKPSGTYASLVSSGGDINGDGYSDVIMMALPNNYAINGRQDEGVSFVFRGNAFTVNNTANITNVDLNEPPSNVLTTIAPIGDINSDGYSDVAILVHGYYNDGVTYRGSIWIYLGSANGLSLNPVNIVNDPDYTGQQLRGTFGTTAKPAGDVNGDGYGDIIVSNYSYSLLVYYGSAKGISNNNYVKLEGPDVNAVPFLGDELFSSVGDVNGDGYGDIIVSHRFYKINMRSIGAFHVFFGSASGLSYASSQLIISPATLNETGFAKSLAGVGDINGDGFDDVIIGAPFQLGVLPNEGKVYVYIGSKTGLLPTPFNILNCPINGQFGNGGFTGPLFGSIVAGAGDVNGDGFSDVIVSAGLTDLVSNRDGAVLLYYGGAAGLPSLPNITLRNTEPISNSRNVYSTFGGGISSAGDINGDGYSDVIVTTQIHTYGGNGNSLLETGRAHIYHGGINGISNVPTITINDVDNTNYYGLYSSCAGDINGDGFSDICINTSLYSDNNPSTRDKRAFFHYGNNGVLGLRNQLVLYNTDLVTPIQQNNINKGNIGVGLYTKSPLGRQKGKLVWDAEKEGTAYLGNPITNNTVNAGEQTSYVDLGTNGIELKNTLRKPGFQNKIRTRVAYSKTTAITGQVYGPWRYPKNYLHGAHGMNSVPLKVCTKPQPKIDGDTIRCKPGKHVFTGIVVSADDIESTTWSVNGVAVATSNHLDNYYFNAGNYTLQFKVITVTGCDSMVEQKIIVDSIKSEFEIDQHKFCGNIATVRFENKSGSKFGIRSYKWKFGDEEENTIDASPTHTYQKPGVYTVTLISYSNYDCTDTLTFKDTIKIFAKPEFSISGSELHCKPGKHAYTTLVTNNDAILQVNWRVNGVPVAMGNSLDNYYFNAGNYNIQCVATTINGCDSMAEKNIVVDSIKADFVIVDNTLCGNNNEAVFENKTASKFLGTTYVWNFGEGQPSTEVSPRYRYQQPNIYPVNMLAKTVNGCTDTKQSSVTLFATPTIRIESADDKCINQAINFIAKVQSQDMVTNYAWKIDGASVGTNSNRLPNTFNIARDYLVTVQVQTQQGCDEPATFPVTIHPLPTVQLGNDLVLTAGETFTINPIVSSDVNSYSWLPSTGLNCTSCATPSFIADQDIKYTLEVATANNCKATDDVSVKVLCGKGAVYMPNSFTPNGDGLNDYFGIKAYGIANVKFFKIYDRWGKLVFSRENFRPTDDRQFFWNGKINGSNVANTGTYAYSIEMVCTENNALINLQNTVTLIK